MDSKTDFCDEIWRNPNCKDVNAKERTIAIIGCGNYSFSNIAFYLAKENPKFLRYTYDTNRTRSRSLCDKYVLRSIGLENYT